MSELLISARGLRKTYELGRRKLEVLCGVDLMVNRGEFLALRGASGAGKSTLLHLLGGLDTPNAGEIKFKTADLHSFSASALSGFRNRSVGFIFQSYHLLPELDALENELRLVPLNWISPAVGVSSPPNRCNNVLLPAPDAPRNATNSPRSTVRFMRRRTSSERRPNS